VTASALPCFGVTITRQLIKSQDIDFGDNGVGFAFTEVSMISSADMSRMEVSMSSRLLAIFFQSMGTLNARFVIILLLNFKPIALAIVELRLTEGTN